jgi:hypothetical protein
MTTLLVNVTHVRREGSVTVLYGTAEDGSPVLVAADARMAQDIAARLDAGEGPVPVTVEPWQIMAGGSAV